MSNTSVCFVLTSAYGYFNSDVPAVGGGARQLSFISRKLTDEFDVHFVVEDAGQPEIEEYDGVTLHRSYTPSPETPFYFKPVHLFRLFRAMRRADADIYVYRGYPWKATFVYLLTEVLGARWVYNLANDSNATTDVESLPKPVRWLFQRALRESDVVISQTDDQRRLLREQYDIDSTVVPSGYPPVDNVVGQQKREHFVWVGRLDENQKRPHLYLNLAEMFPDESFLLIGPRGQDEEYNLRIEDRAGALSNVEYLGRIDPDDVHDFYRTAKALVNTSAFEGFPSTFIEAWRYQTPVVSLSIDPSRYVDIDDTQGFANDDFEKLREITGQVAQNPVKRKDVAEPTFRYFQENLTIDKVAERYASVIRCLGHS